jgi:hypothetical protein
MFSMGIDTTQYGKGLDTAGNKMNSFVSNVKNGLSSMQSALLGIGASLASGFGVFELMKSATDYGTSVYNMSVKMGMGGDQAEYFARMLDLAGVSSTSFVSAMMRLDRSYESSSKTGNLAINTLNAMGISLKNNALGPMQDWNTQLAKLAQGYQTAEAAGYGEEFLTNVFGSRGQEMATLLENYSQYAAASKMVSSTGIDPKESMEAKVNIQALQMEIQQLGYTAAVALMPLVNSILPPLIKALSDIATWIKPFVPWIGAIVIALGSLSAITLVIQWITWLRTAIMGLNVVELVTTTVTKGFAAAMATLSLAIDTDPIGLLIELLLVLITVTLGALGVWKAFSAIMKATTTSAMPDMTKNTGKLSQQMQDALNNVQKLGASFDELYQIGTTSDLSDMGDLGDMSGAEDAADNLEKSLSGKNIFQNLLDGMNSVVDGIEAKWDAMCEFMIKKWSEFTAWLRKLPGDIWNGIKQGWDNTITWMRGGWTTFTAWLRKLPGDIWNGIKQSWTTFTTALRNDWNNVVNWLKTKVDEFKQHCIDDWGAIRTGWNNFTTGIKNGWNGAIAWLKSKGDEFKQWCINAWGSLKTEWNDVGNALKNAWNEAIEWVKNELNSLWQAAQTTWSNITGGVHDAAQAVQGAFQNAVNSIIGFFDRMWQHVQQIWTSMKSLGGLLNIGGGGAAAAMPDGNTGGALMQSMSLGSVPQYAGGGYVTQPTLAMVGEGGPEFIVPQAQLSGLLGAAASMGGGQQIDYATLGAAIGQYITSALADGSLTATINTSRQNMLNLSRAMQPVNQAEALRRGGAPA